MSGETLDTTQEIQTKQQLAAWILEKWDHWDMPEVYQRWKEIEAYKYATDTNNELMGQSAFDHTNHIPVVGPIAQDLEAIISQVTTPHEDWFNFSPQDRAAADKVAKAKVLAYLKNRHKLSNFRKEKRKLDSDFITYGNCFAMVTFADESSDRKNGYIGPKLKRISPYDIRFDPTASEFRNPIIRELISLGELARRASKGLVDDGVARQIIEARRTHGNTRMSIQEKDQQYVPAGFENYDYYMNSGVVEILWFYGDIYDPLNDIMKEGRKIASVNGTHILLDEEIESATGKPHIYHAAWQVRPDNLWGMGPLDSLISINHQVNHRENAKNDALDKLIVPDKVFMGSVEEQYDDETGGIIYLAPEGGGVQELAINTQFFQFDLQIDRLTQIARLAARLPMDLVGFRSAGEKTFGEVQSLTDGAMRGFLHKAQDYEVFLEQILTAELELAADNLSSVIQVPGQVQEGVIPFLDITKKDLQITGSLIPRGAQRFARKNQILSTLVQLANTGMMDRVAAHVSSEGLMEIIEELTELDGSNLFEKFAAITEQAEMQQVQQQAQQVLAAQAAEPTIQEDIISQELGE